ncbi:MAG: ribulose 1,5-bisphosphate carboxylase large subunit, partial [Candidatus Diapherotrites archaeon]|nr:ribulose 1,5-bisphosphate carboxylase large subunit [Candidatus Diapherotrites archaeon]
MSEHFTHKGNPYWAVNEDLDLTRHLVAEYSVTSNLSLDKVAIKIAQEQTTGTWDEQLTTTTQDCAAKVVAVHEGKQEISIAFPVEDLSLDIGGIPAILSLIAGNLFGLRAVDSLRLKDLQIPKIVVDAFPGPQLGIRGIRKITGVGLNKPHLGVITKPKLGLTAKEIGKMAYEAALGG